MAASPAPTMLPDAVAIWLHRLDAIPAGRPPCRYLTPARWTEMRASALDFLDRFGADAVRLGWTARELFGVHPQHGTLCLEMCGVLMTNGRRATGLDEHTVHLGNQSRRRDMPGQAWGPPVWGLRRGGEYKIAWHRAAGRSPTSPARVGLAGGQVSVCAARGNVVTRDRQDRSDDKGNQGQADRQGEKPKQVKLLERQAEKAERALRAAREPQD